MKVWNRSIRICFPVLISAVSLNLWLFWQSRERDGQRRRWKPVIWYCPPLPLPSRLTFVSMTHLRVNVPDSNQLPAPAAGVCSNRHQRQSRLKSGRIWCFKCNLKQRMAHSDVPILTMRHLLSKSLLLRLQNYGLLFVLTAYRKNGNKIHSTHSSHSNPPNPAHHRLTCSLVHSCAFISNKSKSYKQF